jgi:hypothetical protein
MKKNKTISIDIEQEKRVLSFNDNYSGIVYEALNQWLDGKLNVAQKTKEIESLENQIAYLKSKAGELDKQTELRLWVNSQPNASELWGAIHSASEREMKNWEAVAQEFKDGKRKAIML